MSAPRELVELVAAINELRRLADPTLPAAFGDDPVRGGYSDPVGEYAVDGGRWKRLLRRRLRQCQTLADEIRRDVTGLGTAPDRWRCQSCGRFQPPSNRFCGGCGIEKGGDRSAGTPRPPVARPLGLPR